jgi:hypothetical protein
MIHQNLIGITAATLPNATLLHIVLVGLPIPNPVSNADQLHENNSGKLIHNLDGPYIALHMHHL